MSDETNAAAEGGAAPNLFDFVMRSRQREVFALVLAIVAGSIGIVGPSVPAELRFAAAGFVALAILVLASLVARDWWRLRNPEEYQRGRAYEYSGQACGVGYEGLRIVGHLNETDGSMILRREVRLKAFGLKVSKIDQRVNVPNGPDTGAAITGKIIHGMIEGDRTPVKITVSSFEQGPRSHHAILKFEPQIQQNQVLAFTYEEALNRGAMALTLEDQKTRKEDFQYLAWDIDRPVKDFELRLSWRTGMPIANPRSEVWLGKTQELHDAEVKRITRLKGFRDNSATADPHLTLGVRYPVLGGLAYVLLWDPPA